MRLIDADALKEDLRQYFTDMVLDGVSAKLAFNQILHDIDNAPTVCGNNPKWCESCVSNGKCASTRSTAERSEHG